MDLKMYDGNNNYCHKVKDNCSYSISVVQCDFILKFGYIPPDKSGPYASNTANLADGCIFKILYINIPTGNSYQFRNDLECHHKLDPKGEGFITDVRVAWFAIIVLYKMSTHNNYYCQVAFCNLYSIKFFNKNPDNVTIGVVFNNFIAALREYKHAGRTPRPLD